MSDRLASSATRLSPYPEVPSKQRSKHRAQGRPSVPARVSPGYLGMMKQKVRRLGSSITKKRLASGTLAGVGILIWLLMPLGRDATLTDLLSQQGYWEAVPPAESYLPGTINTIEVRSNGKIALHPTCTIDPELLAKVTLRSHTIDRTLAEQLNKGVDVSDQIEEFLPIGMEGHNVKKMKLSLHNSSILQITDEDLILVQKELIKGPCQEAIDINIRNGATVCQARAALVGDLTYEIIDEKSISTPGRKDTVPMLGESQGRVDQMGGKGLIYGVNFLPFAIVNNAPDTKPADCQVGSKNKT
jgi:hypothetical protein